MCTVYLELLINRFPLSAHVISYDIQTDWSLIRDYNSLKCLVMNGQYVVCSLGIPPIL